MSAVAEKIPWQQLAYTAEECAPLFGCKPRTFLEEIAPLPNFPVRVRLRPAAWIAGEVIEWRDANRAGQQAHRRKRRSTAAKT